MPNFKNQRGVISLALLAIGFLVVSLASVTAATNNPLKTYLIDTFAGKNNQYSQGGKWNIKEGCKGSGCVVGPDVKPGGYAITTPTTPTAIDITSLTTEELASLTKACETDKAAGVGNYICTTPGGLQEYSLTNESHKFQAIYNSAVSGDESSMQKLKDYNTILYNQAQAQYTELVKSCEADKVAGVANYICNTPGGLQEYSLTNESHKTQILIKACETDKAAGVGNFICTTPGGLQEYKLTNEALKLQIPQKPAPPTNTAPQGSTPTPSLTVEEGVKLTKYLNLTASKAEVLAICQRISTDCENKNLAQFAADQLKRPDLLDIYNQKRRELEAKTREATSVPDLTNAEIFSLYNFLNTGITPDKDIIQICKKVSTDCETKNLGQFAADELKQAPEFNSQILLDTYNERQRILQLPPGQLIPTQPTQAAPAAGNYSQLDFSNITLPNGKTVAAAGCGLIALTNILNTTGGYNYTPEQVLAMIKPSDWQPDGLISLTDGPIYKILTNTPKYNPDIGTNFNFKWMDYRASPYNLYGRMNATSDVLLIGSKWVYGTKSDGGYVEHITYLTKGDAPGTFKLEKNDYFGSDMICTPGKTNKGEGFNCSNDKGEVVSIPTNNQTTYIYTAPGQ